jgi:hypothetical protein
MKQALADFWRFNRREIKIAVRRYFMPVRVIVQEMYRIAHESDAAAAPPIQRGRRTG